MGPEDFEGIRPQINRIVASVCRHNHLSYSDCDDFRQHTYLEIIKNDYAILRKFQGRSSPSTYLTTVIERLYFQYTYRVRGKWRPSAEAKRLGKTAILLEQLLARDGLTLDEAIRSLTTRENPRVAKSEIERLYLRLPVRHPRPVFVPHQDGPEPPAPDQTDGAVLQEEREKKARHLLRRLDEAMETLGVEDRLLLQMRFWRGRTMPEIAAVLRLDPKKLYKRIDSLISVLADEMARAGVDRNDALDVLRHHNLDRSSENGAPSPSQQNDGELGEGTGRRGDDDGDDH